MKPNKLQIKNTDLIDEVDKILIKLCHIQIKHKDNESFKEMFFYYFYKKFFLSNRMYPYLSDKIKGLTIHDFSHIQGVLKNIYRIIKDRLEYIINEKQNVVLNRNYTDLSAIGFDFFELYYLLMACIYHDTGLMFGRNGHGENIKKLLEIEKDYDIYGNMITDIYNIANAHTGRNVIEKIMKSEIIYSPINTPINQHNLAAILRLADEFHEGPERTEKFQYRHFIDKNNKNYHFFSSCVRDITFNSDDQQVNLLLLIRFDKDTPTEFKKNFNTFLKIRVKKYYEEIKYCYKFDVKNLLYNKIYLDIIYYDKNDKNKEYKIKIEDTNDLNRFNEEINSIFRDDII